jgi:hypothetical protein
MRSAARVPLLKTLAIAFRARSRSGSPRLNQRKEVLASVITAVIGCLSSCASEAVSSHHADPIHVRKVGLELPQPLALLFGALPFGEVDHEHHALLPRVVDGGTGEQHRDPAAVRPEELLFEDLEASRRLQLGYGPIARRLPVGRRQLWPPEPP